MKNAISNYAFQIVFSLAMVGIVFSLVLPFIVNLVNSFNHIAMVIK